jgi:acetyltransferase-like isoleucine patch superfamily enzyme
MTGHQIIVRSGNKLGSSCSIGNNTELFGDSVLGDYVRLHSNVIVCEYAEISDFVWMFPFSILSNGPTPPCNELVGPKIGAYSVIAVNAVVLPGVNIANDCLIGASAVVTKDVPAFSVVVGNPGKTIADIRTIKSKDTGKSHYPWPENFERGMPWQGMDYQQWLNTRK